MLILDEPAVRKFLRMQALIPAMERALRALSAGEVVQPMRVMVPVAEHGGFLDMALQPPTPSLRYGAGSAELGRSATLSHAAHEL